MGKVIIMRGIPGSGKDSYILSRFFGKTAEKEAEAAGGIIRVCSADHFFSRNGEYHFDPSRLGEAHSTCYGSFLEALRGQCSPIVVNNTNVHRWEYANYEFVAGLVGYGVEIVEMQVETIDDVRVCANRNSHGVPMEIVARMALEFEKDSRATKVKIFSDFGKAGAIYPCKDEG